MKRSKGVKKKKAVKAKVLAYGWACVGSHRQIFATSYSPHPACTGRFEIYESEDAAKDNAVFQVVRVTITETRRGK